MSSQDKQARNAAAAERRRNRMRVRAGVFAGVFLAIFGGVVAYALMRVPLYRSTATVQVLNTSVDAVTLNGGPESSRPEPPAEIDFAANTRLMESAEIVKTVAAHLKPEESQRLLKPYEGGLWNGPAPTVEKLLEKGRVIATMSESLMMRVSYVHPDPEMAALVANAFALAFVAACQQANEDYAQKHIAGVAARAEELRAKTAETQAKMNVLMVKYGDASLEMNDGSLDEDLADEDRMIAEKGKGRDAAMQQWEQVQQQQAAGKPAWDLPFIAAQSQVGPLIVAFNNAQEGPAKAMVQQLLDEASASAVETVRTDSVSAQNGYEQAVALRSELVRRIAELAQARKDYMGLDNELKTEKGDYDQVSASAADAQDKFSQSVLNFRVAQFAVAAGAPERMTLMDLVWVGLVAGVAGGAAMAWLAGEVARSQQRRRLAVTW